MNPFKLLKISIPIFFAGCSFSTSAPQLIPQSGGDAGASANADAISLTSDGPSVAAADLNLGDAPQSKDFSSGDGTPIVAPDAFLVDSHVTGDLGQRDVIAYCPQGYSATLKRCNRLDPSNITITEAIYQQVTNGLAFTQATASINTDTGEILDGATVLLQNPTLNAAKNGLYFGEQAQSGSYKSIAFLAVQSLFVSSATTLTITGSRALAFYVQSSVYLGGRIVASGVKSNAGSGGFAGGASSGAIGGGAVASSVAKGGVYVAVYGLVASSGGGGGGYADNGGKGGLGKDSTSTTSLTTVTTEAGQSFGDEKLIPLSGGGGGGAGGGATISSGTNTPTGGYGGGGGGAIQISAQTFITIATSGGILVGGAGGEAGHYNGGGGGGGAGGGILLEAPSITVNGGFLTANGGGGGSGSGGATVQNCNDGANGSSSIIAAAGGITCPIRGGAGGHGSSSTSKVGQPGTQNANGGGGGGAAGRIRLNYLNDPTIIGAAVFSPSPSKNKGLKSW